tara:strand:+ start:1328 stop:1684 length:357 start_codon:yes stop_codon:yes gene_type:complete
MELAGLIKESLDPNGTYQLDTEYESGEDSFRRDNWLEPSDVKQVSGDPLTVAKAIMKKEFYATGFELDKDTYYIVTGDDTITVVGSPKSAKYGGFWSAPDGDQLDQMDGDSMSARKID